MPSPLDIAALVAALDPIHASSPIGPRTRATLRLIDANPELRAPELAAQAGRPTAEFRRDVRKLIERGLTESLAIGYRISPRGEAVVEHLDGPPPPHRSPAGPTAAALGRRSGDTGVAAGRRPHGRGGCLVGAQRPGRPPRRRADRAGAPRCRAGRTRSRLRRLTAARSPRGRTRAAPRSARTGQRSVAMSRPNRRVV